MVAADRERAAIERFEELVRDELNVKALRFVSEADELGRFELKPNYRTLGPRFGKQMPHVAAAVAALDPDARCAQGRRGGRERRRAGAPDRPGRRPARAPAARGLPGGALGHARRGARPRARRRAAPRGRWRARSCTRCRRRARAPGCDVEDRIALTLGGDEELLEAARAHEDYVTGETLAVELAYDGARGRRPAPRWRGRSWCGRGAC